MSEDMLPDETRVNKTREWDCRICGGDGWTDGSAELKADRGDAYPTTECVGCNGTGKELR